MNGKRLFALALVMPIIQEVSPYVVVFVAWVVAMLGVRRQGRWNLREQMACGSTTALALLMIFVVIPWAKPMREPDPILVVLSSERASTGSLRSDDPKTAAKRLAKVPGGAHPAAKSIPESPKRGETLTMSSDPAGASGVTPVVSNLGMPRSDVTVSGLPNPSLAFIPGVGVPVTDVLKADSAWASRSVTGVPISGLSRFDPFQAVGPATVLAMSDLSKYDPSQVVELGTASSISGLPKYDPSQVVGSATILAVSGVPKWDLSQVVGSSGASVVFDPLKVNPTASGLLDRFQTFGAIPGSSSGVLSNLPSSDPR